MFDKLLIANRGEIACRVIRTARRLGISTVAVYSDADCGALHVEAADEAVAIGAAPAAESYLCAGRIIAAAVRTGAVAIHPGYGFLSENAGFSRACSDAGITFIGPPAAAIEAMGSKSEAKQRMVDAGVPVVPGYHGADQDGAVFAREAEVMGYPVLLKASAGGGGKGMRRVDRPNDLAAALAGAKREALAGFGDDRMLLEKLLAMPRHIEIQVFCDSHGNGVYLFERDCSAQRRHQKILEEAPAPGLAECVRVAMGEAAVRAATAIDYRGAGTIEFLYDDASGGFYFMEMNTRLQVEHPVTEMITGEDLVEWQLRVAAGEVLPRRQNELDRHGHAIEARIYAEDPDNGFLPATGVLKRLATPAEDRHVRIDSGVREGDAITPYYDPMIAKLIVCDVDRAAAIRRLRRALGGYRIAGLPTNITFLYNLTADATFANGAIYTRYVEDHQQALTRCAAGSDRRNRAVAGLYLALAAKHSASGCGDDCHSPWAIGDAWRLAGPRPYRFELNWHNQSLVLAVAHEPGVSGFCVQVDGEALAIDGSLHGNCLTVTLDSHRFVVEVVDDGHEVTLFATDGAVHFSRVEARWEHDEDHGGFAAPINGTIIELLVDTGQPVVVGEALLVMEAMKMEHTIEAPADGTVRAFYCAPGDLVSAGAVLLEFAQVVNNNESDR